MNNTFGIDKFVVWCESDDEKLPDVSFVPPMTRRRMTDLQKIAVGLASRVVPDNTEYQVVFASRYGEWRQTIKLIEQFHESGEMSPAGFSNSVHNAAVGAFSVLSKNKNSYTSIAAGNRTLESGILSALMSPKPVLFVFAEEKSPDMYNDFLDAPVNAHGMAFIMNKNGIIKWSPVHNDCVPLTFDAMANFLEQGGQLITSCWEMNK